MIKLSLSTDIVVQDPNIINAVAGSGAIVEFFKNPIVIAIANNEDFSLADARISNVTSAVQLDFTPNISVVRMVLVEVNNPVNLWLTDSMGEKNIVGVDDLFISFGTFYSLKLQAMATTAYTRILMLGHD